MPPAFSVMLRETQEQVVGGEIDGTVANSDCRCEKSVATVVRRARAPGSLNFVQRSRVVLVAFPVPCS